MSFFNHGFIAVGAIDKADLFACIAIRGSQSSL